MSSSQVACLFGSSAKSTRDSLTLRQERKALMEAREKLLFLSERNLSVLLIVRACDILPRSFGKNYILIIHRAHKFEGRRYRWS